MTRHRYYYGSISKHCDGFESPLLASTRKEEKEWKSFSNGIDLIGLALLGRFATDLIMQNPHYRLIDQARGKSKYAQDLNSSRLMSLYPRSSTPYPNLRQRPLPMQINRQTNLP